MDGQQFDRLTQGFTRALNRRRFGAVLAALGLGAGFGAETEAKPKKKKKKKKPKGCASGTVPCGSACVDTQTNAQHCGGCGRPCPSGQACAGGECQQDGGCSGDRELCGADCVNLDNDEQNCGECGRQCPGDLTCLSGNCGCTEGTTCGNSCVDVDDDNAHCGECNRACQGDLTCTNGNCGCASGTRCGNQCVDTQTNQNHCGACDDPCTGNQTCSGGACVEPPECVSYFDCGGYGGGFNDLVCLNGRCVCDTEGQGVCRRHPDRSGLCHECCPGGNGQCLRDFVCHYLEDYLGRPYGACNCPTGWEHCRSGISNRCVQNPQTDSRKCGLDCVDCTANAAICCNGGCITGCGGPGTVCFNQGQPCGPNCLPCNSDSICCNMGPGTLPRCIPNFNNNNVCYQN